ncbi:hypothetical protein [Providencia rettgeri]|uniref:hypothetical protein n=1 Tax=Providencia rettgeri TaxID=587 RepID=UPI00029C311B|nr:hypothetical protein OOC_13664 [Providencia rettgeri Dmel1]
MSVAITSIALEVLKILTGQTGYAISKILEKSGNEISESTANLDELNEKAKKVEIESKALLSQAKVEQELSIARRIMCAQEVEIEEYYDINGKGGVGLKTEQGGTTLGVSGEGSKVTKRVIKFSGFNEKFIQEIKAEIDNIEVSEIMESKQKK